MSARFWMAVATLGVALALLAPSVAPLSDSMDAFASDLANGTFRPFSPPGTDDLEGLGRFSGSLGGLTGTSTGDFLPGAVELPDAWAMDRDGTPGSVVIDYVFNPGLGAMKRLKAYDRIDENGTLLEVADERLRIVTRDANLRYDTVFQGSFDIMLHEGEPTPIYSPHPRALVERASVNARIPGTFSILKDGADTYYAIADHDGVVTLNITYRADSAYFFFQPARAWRTSDYAPELRPELPPALIEDAQVVLSRAGVRDTTDVVAALQGLNDYFRDFDEGDIPPPSEVESLYLALAAGGKGCCRHRAFAYMVTAQAIGIPTRVVVNEAHAFVEVMMPDRQWHQINLGGCGTYSTNNPNDYPSLFDQADDPRAEADPTPVRPIVLRESVTEITESPSRILKGERYFVNGTVLALDGRAVPGARIDVYLNETKEAPGRLTGAGTTDAQGRFSVEARVPPDLPARSYQLVARSTDGRDGDTRYLESWSDPPVDVFAPTAFTAQPTKAAVGVPVNVSGRLLDIDGTPVVNAIVTWTTRTENGTAPTDDAGRFVVRTTFPEIGDEPLRLRFTGDEHHGPADTTLQVAVERGAILLPATPPTLGRGQEGVLEATVALAGANVQGEPIQLVLSGFRSNGQAVFDARADAEGRFTFTLSPDIDTAPGPYAVTYRAPGLELEAAGQVRVLIQPTLTLSVPETMREADALVVDATLRGDDGLPVPSGLVEFTLDLNGTQPRRALTNSSGVARFTLPERALPAGEHLVSARYLGGPDHLSTQASSPIEVVPPSTLHVAAWVPALIIGLAILAALGGHLFGRGKAGRATLDRLLAGGLLPERRLITVRFPEHPEGVPPVALPGANARLDVSATDAAGKPAALNLVATLADASAKGHARPEAPAKLTLPTPTQGGSVRLTVKARGLARLWTKPVHQDLLVTSYREAIERVFVQLRADARLGEDATAGDLVEALRGKLSQDELSSLMAAARLFDLADYSEDPIDLASYHEFATAKARLRRAIEATHAG